mgnify:FL=1
MRKVPEIQILERLQRENPWWKEGGDVSPDIQKMRPRPYLKEFYRLVTTTDVRRAVVLMGPRRVGKTVLLHHAIAKLLGSGEFKPKHICYASVDNPLFNGLNLEEFLQFYSEASGVARAAAGIFVFFDEIQYLRDWEVHLKSLVDSYKHVTVTVSGSAAAALRLKSRESGAGRFTDFLLPPLTFHEYLLLLNLEDMVIAPEDGRREAYYRARDIAAFNDQFLRYLNYGGYPEAVFSSSIREDPGRFIKSDIIDKVLLRDLPSLYGIQDIQELNSLFTTLAYNTAGEVSLEALSKGSGVAKNTIKRYIDYLEAAFLVRVVHRVDRNAKRFRRANFFKIYLTNPSMRAALFAPVFNDDAVIGSLVETALFSHWFHSPTQLYYARWPKGEVDIVNLEQGEQRPLWAIEAKWSDRIATRHEELRGLISFCLKHNLNSPLITTKTIRAAGAIQGIPVRFMPASEYCYTLGKNLVDSAGSRPLINVPLEEPEDSE